MPINLRAVRCRDSFDAVYGASAGAINATYFLTGQHEGVSIYSEDIANRTFCDLTRLVGLSRGASRLGIREELGLGFAEAPT